MLIGSRKDSRKQPCPRKSFGGHFCMQRAAKKTTSQHQSKESFKATGDNPTRGRYSLGRCRRCFFGRMRAVDNTPNCSPCRIGKISDKQWCQEEFVGASFVESSLAPVLNLAIHGEEVLNQGTGTNESASTGTPFQDPKNEDRGRGNPNPQGGPRFRRTMPFPLPRLGLPSATIP